MKNITFAEGATYFTIVIFLIVIGVLYGNPQTESSRHANSDTHNTETFRCNETVTRQVNLVFRSVRYDTYSEYLTIVGIDGTDFYAFVKHIEKQPKLKIAHTEEFVLPPAGEWTGLIELPEAMQKSWPGIDNILSADEKMALWKCFRKKREYQYT